MKCPISRTKVHSILLFSLFLLLLLFFFVSTKKLFLCFFFFSRLYGNSCSLAYESGIREYETHTHTMLPKMYKSYHETENPGIRKSNNSSMEEPAINVDNLPISEEPILIFRPKKGSKKYQ